MRFNELLENIRLPKRRASSNQTNTIIGGYHVPSIGISDRITGLIYGHRDYIPPATNPYFNSYSLIPTNTGASNAVKNLPKPALGINSGLASVFIRAA